MKYALYASSRARFSGLALGGLLLYLVVAQVLNPGFTGFWGYLTSQVAATLVFIVVAEALFHRDGGLSWTTHAIIVATSYADVLGTDGNLYARIDEYDKLTHFCGVAAVTAGSYDILRILVARGWLRALAAQRTVVAVAIGVTAGIAWEVYEFVGDRVFDSTRANGRWDTFNDLVFDTLGALLVAYILAHTPAPATEPEHAPPASAG